MWWWCYSRVLAHHPCVVISVVLVVSLSCLVVVLTCGSMPNFEDPKLGFEARGTTISNRLRTFEKLLESTHDSLFDLRPEHNRHRRQLNPTIDPKVATRQQKMEVAFEMLGESGDNVTYANSGGFNHFCDLPRKEYARVIFESTDLFTLESIVTMCSIEQHSLRSQPAFKDICIHQKNSKECCWSWSLGNYIALVQNKSSCFMLAESDVQQVHSLLSECHTYFSTGALLHDCYDTETQTALCDDVPFECQRSNYAYHLFYHIMDVNFDASQPLTHAAVFLPFAAGVSGEEFYHQLQVLLPLSDNGVHLVAMDFGIKQLLFDAYIRRDAVWFALAAASLFFCVWLFTCSLFITIMSIISMLLSLSSAYFFYTYVYEISFFPFMNLLTAVILIGIGADDLFICCKMWHLAKLEKNAGTLEKLVSDMLKHSALSMFVTSLTTSAAFFAGYVTDITALRCFALFSGTAVISNFIFMVSWTPAVLVFHEKWCLQCCLCFGSNQYSSSDSPLYVLCFVPQKLYTALCDTSRVFFRKVLPWMVVHLRWLWLPLLSSLGVASIVVVFFYPRLRLPVSNHFQMFAHSHPFEVYDLQMKPLFYFERPTRDIHMPLTVVFGVKDVDDGDHMNPLSETSLQRSPLFDLASPDAQRWVLEFCRHLRSAEYYQPQSGMQLTNCVLENFVRFMKRPCDDPIGRSLTPCCQSSSFPFSEFVFMRCIKEYLHSLSQSTHLLHRTPAGLRFSNEDGSLLALIVEFDSKQPFSLNYEAVRTFFSTMQNFMQEALKEAPAQMGDGWFISYLDFFDLQQSIAHGTPVAIAVSLGIASAVAFFTTLNVLISIYAMLSIAFAIFTTIASLVLLGWELNILESVTISIAVGLCIDFTLHYGMAYRLSPDLDRRTRVGCAVMRMGSPVAMAVMTTLLAGALMMPSTVLVYRQLGLFLVLLMSVSWVYGSLFFLSLLTVAGPQGGFGQFHLPSCHCWQCSQPKHCDKTIYTQSESTSSTNQTNHTDAHELEPLHLRPQRLSPKRQSSQESTDIFDFPESPQPEQRENSTHQTRSPLLKPSHTKMNGELVINSS